MEISVIFVDNHLLIINDRDKDISMVQHSSIVSNILNMD